MAMDIQLNRITAIVSNLTVGQTGFAFLIDKNYKLIAMPQAGYKELGIPGTVTLGTTLDPTEIRSQVTPEFWKILDKMSHGQSGLETIPINGTDQFFVYSPLSSIGYSLAIMVPKDQLIASATAAQAQIIQSGTNTLIFSVLLILGILVIAMLAAVAISGALTSPLVSLTRTAEEITRGNLEARAEISTMNEIGTLATALNTMTATLRENIQSLEERVKDRTSELEEASQKADRRAAQFEAIVLIVKAINSIHEMSALLPQITAVISEHMGYYHVGIFLNDEGSQSAVLSASNSTGGERMLKRGHRLKIGEQGIVGYVAAMGKVRVALNVGDDAVYFNNPDLPETLSEMALPLRVENQIVGVLDVQSTQPNAFSQDDIGVLSLLADEVSLAIENTRLFETTTKSLSEAEALYRQYLHEAWKQLPREQQLAGFRYSARGASILEAPVELDDGTENDRDNRLIVPIQLRGETIGRLSVKVPKDSRLSQDQMDLIQAVADHLALSTENARLFDETNRRAERERIVTEITSKIRSTNNPEEMISVALKELKSALGATRVQLIPQASAAALKEDKAQKPSEPHPKADPVHNGNGAKS
jgi:GAF domain-containing protein